MKNVSIEEIEEIEALDKLAKELRNKGYKADVRIIGTLTILSVLEAPEIRTPEIRAGRYVWDSISYKKPSSIANRIDGFLRSVGRGPSNEIKVIATIYGGRKITLVREELLEILEEKKLYENADNLPKWMRWYGGFESFEAVFEAIEGFLNNDGVTEIDVASY